MTSSTKKDDVAPSKPTPLMEQYYTFKHKYPDALLLFRVGDFYETFGDDALVASQALNIVLTKRANGTSSEIALAGFPHHALDNYLPKLIQAGHRVAICDQQETPEQAKARGSKVVKRNLIELATPSLVLNEGLLKEKRNRYLAALYLGKKQDGLSLLDISTGTFLVYEGSPDEVWTQLEAHAPAELIFSKEQKQAISVRLPQALPTFAQEPWMYTRAVAKTCLIKHFGTAHLMGFGVDHMHAGLIAAGAILQYLQDTAHTALAHVSALGRLDEQPYLWMDIFTVRNLELVEPLQAGGQALCEVVDRSATPMGGRLLRSWLLHPLRRLTAIEERQACVAYLHAQPALSEEIRALLSPLGDMERMSAKVALQRMWPRDLLRLAQSLQQIKTIKACFNKQVLPPLLGRACGALSSCDSLAKDIIRGVKPDAALSPAQGRLFQRGYHTELDELLEISENESVFLQQMQTKEAKHTGITSLKIGHNRVFGYYLEVRNTHHQKVPANWVRKQTLTGAERYTTEELKNYEERMLTVEAQRIHLEEKLLAQLLSAVLIQLPALQANAVALAQIDVLVSLATVAIEHKYVAPKLNETQVIDIQAGRHPVIEAALLPGAAYVPNDLRLDSENQQILLITGPNMSGKSALLRQTALIVILAQIGAFVPATSAQIGIRDKLFTRVGASDNIAAGQSTFMIEMSETASILNNMSDHSLLLMDEIGRGTSTYDGLSVAWALLEYVHAHSQAGLLFATHYHELNDLCAQLPRMQSFHVAVKKIANQIIFLHSLRPGSTTHSFGIHVARMAGMPATVVRRAEEILAVLQQQRKQLKALKPKLLQKNSYPSLF